MEIADDIVPPTNKEYKDKEYWDARYNVESTKDWLVHYDVLKSIIHQYVDKTDRILILGCGNSMFSESMYLDGYRNITNIDYSPVVISKMARSSRSASHMEWRVMDARDLAFPDCAFDVVVEKATIDAMMVEERNPWSLSGTTKAHVQKVLNEVSRVLTDEGRFISVTFSQPHFRGTLYADPVYGWSYTCHKIGSDFHHFAYIMVKGQPLQELPFVYQPPLIPESHQPLEDDENANFILAIGL